MHQWGDDANDAPPDTPTFRVGSAWGLPGSIRRLLATRFAPVFKP